MTLSSEIAELFAAGEKADRGAVRAAVAALRSALSDGTARAAEPDASAPAGWKVNAWVKQGILLAFRFGDAVDMSADHGRWPFVDKDTLKAEWTHFMDGKSMGQVASELLASSLREQAGRPRNPGGLTWIAKDLGRPLADLEDKEAVRALFDVRE